MIWVPFEPLKYEEHLASLKARIAKEGSKAIFSPSVDKYILKESHLFTFKMNMYYWVLFFSFNYKMWY